LEFLSWLAYNFSQLNLYILILTALVTVILCFKDSRYYFYIPIAELAWGSLGHGFEYGYFNLRLSIFLAVIFVWFVKNINFRNWKILKDGTLLFIFLFLLVFVAAGVLNGYLKSYPIANIFFDANAYLYLFYLPVWYQIFESNFVAEFFEIIKAAAIIIALKTVIIFNIFVADYSFLNTNLIYKWIRDTRTGEITPFGQGFFRIFFQSQFYLLLAWFYMFLYQIKDFKNKTNFLLLSLISAALLISLSRSFWLGAFVGLVFLLINIFFYQKKHLSVYIFVWLFVLLISSSLIVLFFYNTPKYHGFNIFYQRTVDSSEAAASSRSQLLGPMKKAIGENIIIGSGFGRELTYQSSDPRIKNDNNPDGTYTTYAFEWGWLDMWLKAGLGIILVFFIWLWQIYQRGYKILNKDPISVLSILSAITSLIIIHIFTPYINHPLGLGLLMISIVIFTTYAKEKKSYY